MSVNDHRTQIKNNVVSGCLQSPVMPAVSEWGWMQRCSCCSKAKLQSPRSLPNCGVLVAVSLKRSSNVFQVLRLLTQDVTKATSRSLQGQVLHHPHTHTVKHERVVNWKAHKQLTDWMYCYTHTRTSTEKSMQTQMCRFMSLRAHAYVGRLNLKHENSKTSGNQKHLQPAAPASFSSVLSSVQAARTHTHKLIQKFTTCAGSSQLLTLSVAITLSLRETERTSVSQRGRENTW